RAYPFHPTALTALPHLFRRLAQNERSAFAYLTSHEPFGFQEFLQQHAPPSSISLADLFDYVLANFQAPLYTARTGRALTETQEWLQGAAELTATEARVLKTVGLLNWLSHVSHLQATETTLLAALTAADSPVAETTAALKSLCQRSILVYRRFDRSYRIWQGSDVDIEERLEAARRQLTGAFSLAEAVQQYLPPRPLVARRHSHRNGTLRFFKVRYLDWASHEQISPDETRRDDGAANGHVFVCLPANPWEVAAFGDWAQEPATAARADWLVIVAGRTLRLHELVYELRCLYWVRENTPALRDDIVARRELRERVTTIEALIHGELPQALSLHRLSAAAGCRWYYQGQEVTAQAARGLTTLLSVICDQLYAETPRLWNELLNRRTLSSQGAAARRNLIEAMLSRAASPRGATGAITCARRCAAPSFGLA
ncbi:MAG: hypothetical protein DCC57_24835, partial [Chloroflexi bacterium]